jgi:hypothetical protein
MSEESWGRREAKVEEELENKFCYKAVFSPLFHLLSTQVHGPAQATCLTAQHSVFLGLIPSSIVRYMQVASLSRFSSFFFIFGAVELDGNMEQDMGHSSSFTGQATDSVRSTNAKKRTLGFGPLFFSFITILE